MAKRTKAQRSASAKKAARKLLALEKGIKQRNKAAAKKSCSYTKEKTLIFFSFFN